MCSADMSCQASSGLAVTHRTVSILLLSNAMSSQGNRPRFCTIRLSQVRSRSPVFRDIWGGPMTCESSAKLKRWSLNVKFCSAACAVWIRASASQIRRKSLDCGSPRARGKRLAGGNFLNQVISVLSFQVSCAMTPA